MPGKNLTLLFLSAGRRMLGQSASGPLALEAFAGAKRPRESRLYLRFAMELRLRSRMV